MFSRVECCSQMCPGLVSSSTTVWFLSTEFRDRPRLTITSDNISGSVAMALWRGVALLHYVLDGRLESAI